MLFSIRFKLRNQNHNPQTNLTPIYVRISVNGVTCSDFYSGVRCEPERWRQKEQRIIGTSRELLQDNETLMNVRTDLKELINNLKPDETVHTVRRMYLEKKHPVPTLIECFAKYIKEVKESEILNLSTSTIEKWNYSKNHLSDFLKCKNVTFELSQITKNLSKEYYKHLMSLGTMKHDHAVRNVSYLNSVVDWAVDELYIEKNPISMNGLSRGKTKPLIYLESHEVLLIEKMQFPDDYQEALDLFLLIVYTSMDNNELQAFDKRIHMRGDAIIIERGKGNGGLQIIPVLPKARLIFEKYNYKLPTHSTTTINRFMLVIEKMLDLPYRLTTKIARKTAGMWLLTNGVPIEVVSRILGHKSIVTTQKHYADVLSKIMVLEHTKHLMK